MDKITNNRGIVFDIQRFSVHDGHGIRTVVFLKGCPLRCEWCSNPESQTASPQIGFLADKCAACFKCVAVCPHGQFFKERGRINWEACERCLQCVESCVYGARILYGKAMTVQEVVTVIKKDKVFYANSNGGVTLGGGEVTSQAGFARNILRKCQAEGIHTAIETCGFAPPNVFETILPSVDLLLFDIKHIDSNRHKEKTGVGNDVILKNAINASRTVKEMIIRFPLIPNFNDDVDHLKKMGAFIRMNMPDIKRLDILPYHSMGASKKRMIGQEYAFTPGDGITKEKLAVVKNVLKSYGLQISIGG